MARYDLPDEARTLIQPILPAEPTTPRPRPAYAVSLNYVTYLPGQMHLARYLSGIASPVITGDKAHMERRKQAQQPTACIIIAWAKGIGHDSFSLGIKSIPKPMSMLFIADTGPLLIKFTDKRHVIEHHLFGGYLPWGEFFRARMTVLMPILRTRAVSRTPEPLNAISTILSLTPGLRAS